MSKKYSELLPAIAYGDAAGLVVETKNAHHIAQRYKWIDTLLSPIENPFFGGDWPAGTTSDDTQLSVAVAEALINADEFSIASQAASHIAAYHAEPSDGESSHYVTRGWGRSTTEAIERVIDGASPLESGQDNGAGNGVIMKLAPLALWNTLRDAAPHDGVRSYDTLTAMTHNSDIARITTRLHGKVLQQLIEGNADTITEDIVTELLPYKMEFPNETAMIRRAVENPCSSFEELVHRYAKGKSGYKYGFYVPETLAIVYDIFLGSGGDYETAVFRAVNLGGDSDSTASIVGAMSYLANPEGFSPPADFETVSHQADHRRLSIALAHSALNG